MPSSSKRPGPARNPLLERLCECLPNCSKAMALVETGCERDLNLREKVALKYHGRLCPFCACATGKFESALNRMEEAEKIRATVPAKAD
ncbi:MAG TPA: hypothetical protein VJ960_08605 [Oceanipulchritudo sp.]|nr:hypothetical protein [Oceanipulchritudo sp.]